MINGAAQLAAIEAEISKRVAGAAVELDDRALLPHLTLGRVKMAGAGIDWPKVLQACEVRNATSHVDKVSLYQSKLVATRAALYWIGQCSADRRSTITDQQINRFMELLPAILIGYAIGSLPIGYLVAQSARGVDLRQVGSGNVGAANVYRTGGLPHGDCGDAGRRGERRRRGIAGRRRHRRRGRGRGRGVRSHLSGVAGISRRQGCGHRQWRLRRAVAGADGDCRGGIRARRGAHAVRIARIDRRHGRCCR